MSAKRCARCGIGEDGLIHRATANGHPFIEPGPEYERWAEAEARRRWPEAFSSQAGLGTFAGRGRYRIDTAPMRNDDQA